MTYVPDPVVFPAALEVLAALQTELAKVNDPPVHYRVYPGTEAIAGLDPDAGIDEACQGIGWVRVAGFWGTADFPQQISAPEAAQGITPTSWAVQMEVGVLRCGGGPGANSLPTDAQITAAAQAQLDDAAAMRRVPETVMAHTRMIIDYVFGPGPYEPVTAEGGAEGGIIHLTLQLPNVELANC